METINKLNIPAFNINTIDDVKIFFSWLVANDLMLYPDDDFNLVVDVAEYIDKDAAITRKQANVLNALMTRCVDICMENGENIYVLSGWEDKWLNDHMNNAVRYVQANKQWSKEEFDKAFQKHFWYDCPIVDASQIIYNEIERLMEEYTINNNLPNGWWRFVGVDTIFGELYE